MKNIDSSDIGISFKVSDFELVANANSGVMSSEVPQIYYLAKAQGGRPQGKLYSSYQRWKNVLRVSGLTKATPNDKSPFYCAAILDGNDEGEGKT
jgi:hypothetical protein